MPYGICGTKLYTAEPDNSEKFGLPGVSTGWALRYSTRGWLHVKYADEVFPGVFNQKERPDFVWDIFASPTDVRARWVKGDVVFSWAPARAVIEVKALSIDLYDRLRDFKPGTCAIGQSDRSVGVPTRSHVPDPG